MYKKLIFISLIMLGLANLSGCGTTPPPDNIHNLCSVFQQYPKWYWASQDVQQRWGVPISVQMAIIYQESRFRPIAKPPRDKILWVIPWARPTSAFGYSQATDGSWRTYQRATGNSSANRDNFYDAIDFIGWYAGQAYRRVGIHKGDPYRLYLAYHEGIGGYSRATYRKKAWLIDVARGVQRRAWAYHSQLLHCQSRLPQKHWWNIF